MSDVSKSLLIATILFTSTSPAMICSQEPSPVETGNVAEVHDSLSTEPTSILIMRPELDSLRTMAAAIVARNKHIRIQEPGAASGEPKQLEAELWLQPEVPNEIVEKIIGDVAKFGIVRIQLVRPFHDPDNTVVITAPANTPQGTIKDLQTNLALPDGFKLDVRSRDNEASASITLPQEIQSQITQLEVELAVQKLRMVAEHPSIKSLEERIAALRKTEESEPKPPVTVLPLRHAKATDVAEKFKQLDLGPVDAIVVDERTNSLMIRGTERQIKDIEQLIEVLDAEVSPTGHGEAAEATTPAAGLTADGASPLGSGASGGRSPFDGNEPGKQTVNEAGLPDLVTVKVTASKAATQHPELKPLLDDLGALDFPVEGANEPAVAAAFITVPAEFSRKEWITLTSHLLDAGGVRVFFVDRKPDNKVTELTIFVKATSDETGKVGFHAESTQAIRTQLEKLPNLDVKYIAVAGDVSQLVRFNDEQNSLAAAEIKAFSLQHVAAQDAQRIIVELFEHDGTAISAEQKSNTLLVRGEPGRLAEIEAILMRLDEKAAAEHKDATTEEPQTKAPSNPLSDLDGGSSPPAESPIAEFRRRLNDLEKPVLDLAEKVRAAGTSLGKEHPEYQKLLAELRALVQQTFAARQEIQRAELAEFTRRLERMKQAIETREKIADKIVDRRVEELLNPNIEWSQPHGQSASQESPFASTAPEPRAIKRDKAELAADKETVSLTLFEVTDAKFMASDDKNVRQTVAPEDFYDQLAKMRKWKTATSLGSYAIETALNQMAVFDTGGALVLPAQSPKASYDGKLGTTIEVTPQIVAGEKSFDITWNRRPRNFNNVVSGILGIDEQQVHVVVNSPRPGGAGYLIGPLAGSSEGRRLFIHFVLVASRNVTPQSQWQAESAQIRLRCNLRMSIDSGDVVFADNGRVATISRMVGIPMGFSFVEGDHRGPYLLTFERNGSSEEAQAWLNNNVVPIEFLADDQELTAAGQLVTKVIYLNSDTGAVETISGHDVEAGVDPVSVAAEKGTVIGVVRISRGERGSLRTGASVFENRYERATIAIGDILEIVVSTEDKVEPQITFSARVSDEGAVTLSELGQLKLAGLSTGAAEQKLVEFFKGTTQFETTPSIQVDVVHPGPRTRSIEAEIVFTNADGELKVAYWHGIPIDGTNTVVLVGNEFLPGDMKGLQARAALFKKSIESIKVLTLDAQGTVAVPAKIERFNSELGLLLVSLDSQHVFASLPLESISPASGQKVHAERLTQGGSVLLSECTNAMPGMLRVKPEGWTQEWDGAVIMDSTGKQLLGLATTFSHEDSSCEGLIPASAIKKWLSNPISEISVDLISDQKLEVTLPYDLPRSASKAASFEIFADRNTQLQLSKIEGAENLNVLLTIEPRCSASEAIDFYQHHQLKVELKDSDLEQLKSGMHITKALYVSPGSDEIRANINVTEKADVPPIEVGFDSAACVGIVRMSPAEANSL